MSRTAAKENVGLTYNSVDLRAHLNSVSMEDVVEVIESMTFASTAIEKGAGARHSRSAGRPVEQDAAPGRGAGHADAADDAAHAGLLCRSVGQPRDARTWTGLGDRRRAIISNYKIDATDPKGDIVWTGTPELSGLPVES